MFRRYQSLIVAGAVTSLLSGLGDDASAGGVCPIESSANCQAFDDSLEFRIAELSTKSYADDLRPVSDTISSVCVWGRYAKKVVDEFGQISLIDCADTYANQHFDVRLYDSNALGFPNAQVAWPPVFSFNRVYLPGTAAEAASGIRSFAFRLPLGDPIVGLDTSGATCYWLSVRSFQGAAQPDPECDWYWSATDTAYNDVSAVPDLEGDPEEVVRFGDLAYCVDCGIQTGGCAATSGYCCACDGTCRDASFRDCRASDDNWQIGATCADVQPGACSTNPPVNDTCAAVAAAAAPPPGPVTYRFDNFCADTDGVNPVRTEWEDGVEIEGDVWFKYINEGGGWPQMVRFNSGSSTPAAGGGLDNVIEVYHDPENPTVCVCPSNAAEHDAWTRWALCDDALVFASDDFGHSFASGGFMRGPAEQNGCYMVRIGGKLGAPNARGYGLVEMYDYHTDLFGFVAPDVTGHDKNRYLGFSAVYSNEVAISVRAESLPGFPAAEGVRYWVGPPRDVPDENSAVPGQTMRVAPLQCEPYIADWSTFGLVYVYGAEIIPGARYELAPIEDPECCRRTDGNLCSHPSTIVTTAKFGDVVELFDNPVNPPQPDFNDIAMYVQKFLASPSAPSKVYMQLVPNVVRPDRPVDFKDIAASVQAFLGTPCADLLEITGPCTCPSAVVCGATACGNDTRCAGGYCIDGLCTDACGRCSP